MAENFIEWEDNLEEEVKRVKLYAVRHPNGNWFRKKDTYGRKTWTCDITQARLYPKPGPARAMVTFFFNLNPMDGIPRLVEFTVGEFRIMDEAKRVQQNHQKKIASEKRAVIEHEKWLIKRAQKKLQEAQDELERLGA